MKSLPFILLAVAAAAMSAATVVESFRGTTAAMTHVYGTVWFAALWGLVVVLMIWTAVRKRMWRNAGSLILHAAFAVIFTGGALTACTRQSGIIHLRKNYPTCEYVNADKQVATLPFLVRLDSFQVICYAGTDTEADYVSRVTFLFGGGRTSESVTISMNNICTMQGYRFCQSSFDHDRDGSWLTVNYDPFGTTAAYAGFLLAGLGALLILLAPNGSFRRLLRHPLLRRGGLFILLLCPCIHANASLPVVNRAQADSLARLPVVFNGRIAPFDTQARAFLQKVYGRQTFHGLTAAQVVSSWPLGAKEWDAVPLIRIKSPALRDSLGIDGNYAALNDLLRGRHYKLQDLWQHERGTGSKLEKAIMETDEKVGLILMLRQGTLIKTPEPGAAEVSKSKIEAELIYNRVAWTKLLFMTNLTLGLVAFALMLMSLLRARRLRRAWDAILTGTLYAVTLFHLTGYALRGYVSGRLPLGNGYETMEFAALIVLLCASLLQRRFSFLRAFGFLLSGFILLVAYLGEMNPQLTSLVPVLSSAWLSWHVSVIMISYALYGLVCLNAMFALCLLRRRDALSLRRVRQLTLLSRMLLYPATFLLGAGIMLGSVWANVAWGSWWSWDPKEVWALAAFIVYGISFHRGALPCFRRPAVFHAYMIFAFCVVLMTYFGVNYLLGGLHSYAN